VVNIYTGPRYEMGCGDPPDADPAAIAALGPAKNAPAFGPADLLVFIGFFWWAAYGLIAPVAAIAFIAGWARLSRRWST
jgi:hypothetical protein